MTDCESESSNLQETKKSLGLFEAGVLLSILALFVPYGIEYYVVPMCEHVGTLTYWLFSAPLWHTVSVESFFRLEFTSFWAYPFIWYLFLIRALSVVAMLLYYANRHSKNKTILLFTMIFVIEFLMIIIPLPTGFVSTPTYSIPIPLYTMICFILLHLRSPENKQDTEYEPQKSMEYRNVILLVCIMIMLCFIIAPGFYVYWDTGYHISIRMHSLFPPNLFSEDFLIHHIYRFLFAAQVIRYYLRRTSFHRALLPGLVGISLTLLLNIPSYVFGFETPFYWYSPDSYVLPVPILFCVGVFLMILKPFLDGTTPGDRMPLFQKLKSKISGIV